MALINGNGNYLKIDKISLEKMTYSIYKDKSVRKNLTEFDNVIVREIEIIPEQIGNMDIVSSSVKNVLVTAGYLYLKTTPMFESWSDV